MTNYRAKGKRGELEAAAYLLELKAKRDRLLGGDVLDDPRATTQRLELPDPNNPKEQ